MADLIEITSKEQFQREIQRARAVALFSADFCDPCEKIKGLVKNNTEVDDFLREHEIQFLNINVPSNLSLTKLAINPRLMPPDNHIRIPHTDFYLNGQYFASKSHYQVSRYNLKTGTTTKLEDSYLIKLLKSKFGL